MVSMRAYIQGSPGSRLDARARELVLLVGIVRAGRCVGVARSRRWLCRWAHSVWGRVYGRRKPVYLGGPSKKGPHAEAYPHQKNVSLLVSLSRSPRLSRRAYCSAAVAAHHDQPVPYVRTRIERVRARVYIICVCVCVCGWPEYLSI